MPNAPEPALLSAVSKAVERLSFVAAAWLFGSMARGDPNERSDLDLAVLLGHEGAPAEEERRELETLAAELERFAPGGRVDVLVLGRGGPVLHHRVLREGILVADRHPRRRVDFVASAIVAYLDWEPTHRIGMEQALKGLAARLGRSAA